MLLSPTVLLAPKGSARREGEAEDHMDTRSSGVRFLQAGSPARAVALLFLLFQQHPAMGSAAFRHYGQLRKGPALTETWQISPVINQCKRQPIATAALLKAPSPSKP